MGAGADLRGEELDGLMPAVYWFRYQHAFGAGRLEIQGYAGLAPATRPQELVFELDKPS